MVSLQDIRCVRVGTADLASAIRFATEVLGIQLVAREGRAACFCSDKVAVRGGIRDHTMVYVEGDPKERAIGFDLRTIATPPSPDALISCNGYRHPRSAASYGRWLPPAGGGRGVRRHARRIARRKGRSDVSHESSARERPDKAVSSVRCAV